MIERRATRRYDVSLPVIIRGPLGRNAGSQIGRTRNISTGGVYFTIDNSLSAGAALNFAMAVPVKLTRGAEVFLEAIGKVLRVDNHGANGHPLVGVAVVIEQCEIIRSERRHGIATSDA